MKKLLASVMLAVYTFSITPIPAKAQDNTPQNEMLQFKMEVESSKLRDVYQSSGMAIGVYDPYGKNFKIFRYWIGVGTPKVDRLTNSDCTKPVFAWLKGKHPIQTVNTSGLKNCKVDSRYNDVMACQNDKGQTVYYDVNDKKRVDITPLQGAFCRQVVGPTYLRDFMHLTNIDVSNAGSIPSYDGKSSIDNYVIRNISYDQAMELLARYSFRNKLPFAIMVLHTFDVYTKKSKSAFKTKITYHFIEKPQYYILMAGTSAGTPFKYGYNILDGQAVGNNLTRWNTEILTKSKSGWTGFAIVLFQVALVALTYGAFSAMMPTTVVAGSLTAGELASIGMSIGFGIQDLKSGVFNNLFDGMYSTKNLLKDGIVGGFTGGAGNIIMNDGYQKNTDIITGDGADQITQRTIYGHDGNAGLSGFNEATKEKNAYWNWNKPTGGFIPNDKY